MSAVALDDGRLADAVRAGDELAFCELVDRYQTQLVRVAMMYVRNRSVAEEVVQEAWLGVLTGIDRFEQRSLFKTWVFRIVSNIAKTRAARERRTVPFSSLVPPGEASEPSVDPDRFLPEESRWAGHWAAPPVPWDTVPERRLIARETLAVVGAVIEGLPLAQREVVTLRDVEGWTAEEVCDVLAISDANQRVLLHRARSRIRAALERYLDDS